MGQIEFQNVTKLYGETPAYTDYIHCVRSDFIE